MTRVHNRYATLLFLVISFVFSLLQHHLIIRLMGNQYIASAEAAKGVITGYPHWRVYQNRVLGPYLVEWLSQFTPSFLSAYFIFSIIAFTAAGYLACYLGRE